MQEDLGSHAEPSTINKVTNMPDTLVPIEDFNNELLEITAHELWKGRVFPDRDTFRKTLAKFAMYKNFLLKHLKTNKYKVTARCGDATCPWRVHASIVDSGPQFQIRTYNLNHSCSKPTMGIAHKEATSALIAEFAKDRLRFNNKYTPKEIMFDFQMEFGVSISYRKAHYAKEIAMHEIRGSFEESFETIPRYCMELQMMNPGTRTDMVRHEDDSFKRLFWAIGACIESFCSSLRPVIAVDGAHLRGKYPGVILTTATYDGNHQLFPLAFAIVEAERRDSWSWFFGNLHIALGQPRYLTIVSDRQKGLLLAVEEVIPNAHHCYCCRHIAENVRTRFKDDAIVKKFWFAAKSYRPCEYEAHMHDIRAVNEEAYNYIHGIGRQHWANAFVEGREYDMLTQNIAECLNSLLRHNRELPITKVVDGIRGKLMDLFHLRRTTSMQLNSRLTPWADRILSNSKEGSRRLICRQAGEHEFEVQSWEFTDVVHLDRKSCTCRMWAMIGIPCEHAMSAISKRGLDPYDYCEDWYTSNTYRMTYSHVIHPTRDIRQWEHITHEVVKPPLATRQPGRPKKNRIRTEEHNRQRRQVTCSVCKKKGHNRQKCRNPPMGS